MTPTASRGKRAAAYFGARDPVLYLILFFCIAGLLRNMLALSFHGFDYTTISTRVFLAISVIYFAPIVLILLRARNAWIVSALPSFFCFFVYEGFTALPFATLFKMTFGAGIINLDYGWIYFINMAIISAMFSLELLKTYLIYVLTVPAFAKKKKPAVKKEKSEVEETVL